MLVLLDIWHHIVHIQDRLLCCHIDVGIVWENDNPINGDVIPKYKPPQSLDMPFILYRAREVDTERFFR